MKHIFSVGESKGWPSSITIYTDGASRGNPGRASIGFSVLSSKEGGVLFEYGQTLGYYTNNYAEYMAVFKALDLAVNNKVESLVLYSDSQFLVEQISGNYKVKSSSLKPIYQKCMKLLGEISSASFKHVRREKNKRADEIANIVLDQWEYACSKNI